MRGRLASQLPAVGIGLVVILGAAGDLVWSRADANELNVILVMFDTTRADRLGCHGDSFAQAPVINALARTGVLFEFARTPYPLVEEQITEVDELKRLYNDPAKSTLKLTVTKKALILDPFDLKSEGLEGTPLTDDELSELDFRRKQITSLTK